MTGTAVKSFLDMSDEELANVDPSTIGAQATDQEANTGAEDSSAETSESSAGDPAEIGSDADPEEAVTAASSDSNEEDATSEDENAEESQESTPEQKASDVVASSATKEKPADADAADKPKEADAVTVDYKAEYERLTAPFKANGRDIQVKNVDDAITLMQMGANYNKKMAALKPNLKLMKMLEHANLLSEEKLSFLIDLDKRNPQAIGKLIKDAGLDPMDLDPEKSGDYRPTARTVDDREIELDTVLDEIQDTPSYTKTLDIVSNRWDGTSKNVIAASPQLLKVINAHVQSGIYDLISKEVESERMFGRLTGLSDIEAYRQVGDAIQARGGFDHLAQKATPATQGHQTAPATQIVQPKPKMGDDDKRREKRIAASTTKPAASAAAVAEFNPLALSDEEFGKQIHSRYL